MKFWMVKSTGVDSGLWLNFDPDPDPGFLFLKVHNT